LRVRRVLWNETLEPTVVHADAIDRGRGNALEYYSQPKGGWGWTTYQPQRTHPAVSTERPLTGWTVGGESPCHRTAVAQQKNVLHKSTALTWLARVGAC
jgi:hypothetical protein